MTVRERIWGERAAAIERALAEADPDLARYVVEFAYEEVMARPGLDLKARELQAISLLIALGSPPELATHLEGALRVGASEREVRETIIHAALYVGFPRALAAMKAFAQVLARRRADGGTPP
ncbi:MAG: carboxymuconolactone decarboxylase family protein [Acidobacteriota bacterium]